MFLTHRDPVPTFGPVALGLLHDPGHPWYVLWGARWHGFWHYWAWSLYMGVQPVLEVA